MRTVSVQSGKSFLRHSFALLFPQRHIHGSLCTMPRGHSGHTRIGTFTCRSNSAAHPKQAKEPPFSTATKDKLIQDDLTNAIIEFSTRQRFWFRRQLQVETTTTKNQ
jgi:hypothetical protein